MLETVELQLESFELDSRAKSLELTALKESNMRSSHELQSIYQQVEALERFEGQVETLLQQLE